jgi:hypothetical protein
MQTPEGIAKAIETLYDENYQTYLTEVEGDWSASDPITLYDFEEIRITVQPEQIVFFTSFPSLGIAVGNLVEVPEGDIQVQRAARYYAMDVRLVYYLRGIDDRELAKVVLRHIQASQRFFQDNPRLGLGNFVSIDNIRFEPSANVYDSGGNSLVKGLRIRFDLMFMQGAP